MLCGGLSANEKEEENASNDNIIVSSQDPTMQNGCYLPVHVPVYLLDSNLQSFIINAQLQNHYSLLTFPLDNFKCTRTSGSHSKLHV